MCTVSYLPQQKFAEARRASERVCALEEELETMRENIQQVHTLAIDLNATNINGPFSSIGVKSRR